MHPVQYCRCIDPCCGIHPQLRNVWGPVTQHLGGLRDCAEQLGQMWAVCTGVGRLIEVQVAAAAAARPSTAAGQPAHPPPLHLRYNLVLLRVAPAVGGARPHGCGGDADGDEGGAGGVQVVSGATQDVHVGLLPGREHQQRLLLRFTRPGLYQVRCRCLS